jgi:beta-glucosidase
VRSSGGFRQRLLAAARSDAVDAIVACVGEHPYAEKPGDIDSLGLDEEQIDVVKDLKAATGKPLVVVLVEGRTRLLRGLPDAADAVVYAMLPGPFGGQAVAEVLLGKTNPSGRLPVTYPKKSGTALHSYYAKVRTYVLCVAC